MSCAMCTPRLGGCPEQKHQISDMFTGLLPIAIDLEQGVIRETKN